MQLHVYSEIRLYLLGRLLAYSALLISYFLLISRTTSYPAVRKATARREMRRVKVERMCHQ